MLQLQGVEDTSQVINLEQSKMSIGREATNDIVLGDGRVSGFHANIFNENHQIEVVDLGSTNGTFVNGKRLNGRVQLNLWDIIRFGDSEFTFVDPQVRRPTIVQPALSEEVNVELPVRTVDGQLETVAKLKLVSGSGGTYPAEIEITKNSTLGRSTSNTIILDSEMVSCKHAELIVSGKFVEVKDLGSTNGTYVNGRKVTSEILKHGDMVRFDEIEYLVEYPGADIGKTTVNPALLSDANKASVNFENNSQQQNKSPSNQYFEKDKTLSSLMVDEYVVNGDHVRRIVLKKGNIVDEYVDAIVNAANSNLQHGSGVAGAIVKAGGYDIQIESNNIGYVPVGSCAITSAGKLAAKYIIHAVGPRIGEGDEENKLRRTMQSVLTLATEKKFQAISVPAISSGVFGFPKEKCAEILFHESIKFFNNVSTSLQTVIFCLIDDKSVSIFKREFDSAKNGNFPHSYLMEEKSNNARNLNQDLTVEFSNTKQLPSRPPKMSAPCIPEGNVSSLKSPENQSSSQVSSPTIEPVVQDWKWWFFSMEGRLGRAKYFGGSMLIFLINLSIRYVLTTMMNLPVESMISGFTPPVLIASLITIWPGLCVGVKRCHDLNKSGHFLWLYLVPIANFVVAFMVLFVAGTKGENDYGEVPE